MLNCIRFAIVVLIVLKANIAGAQNQPNEVMIEGYVLDVVGKPVASAVVSIFPFGVSVNGRLPTTTSDKNGAYHLGSPAYGPARISAHKEIEGYPDTQSMVFATGAETFVELDLRAGSVFRGVDIHLDKPDGIIQGTVRDKDTGLVIKQARITLRRRESPEVMCSSYLNDDGSFSFALPKRPITLSISAPGYRSWVYRNTVTGQQYAALDSLARERVEIRLEAVTKP